MSLLMVRSLVQAGFSVHLYDWQNEYAPVGTASVFIGHGRCFHRLASKAQAAFAKVLLTTSSSPRFDNAQVTARFDDFNRRHGLRVPYEPPPHEHVMPNVAAADKVYMMGSDFIAETWPGEYRAKRHPYHNVSSFFLYISGTCVLRRGLDLLIDAFRDVPHRLLICSPTSADRWFFDYYRPVLAQSGNIRCLGYVDTAGSAFRRLAEEADYVILPSCSESESSSVLNAMTLGLLPVVTENAGFADVERYGFLIKEAKVDGIRDLVRRIVGSDEATLSAKRDALYDETAKYTPEAFAANFSGFLRSLPAAP
jgi:glycosyltransferase involved in cell wall biosynthesis